VKVCDKTCIFCFFPIINKYLCMAKRSLLSERPSYLFPSHPEKSTKTDDIKKNSDKDEWMENST
jgi:hypothetical protein